MSLYTVETNCRACGSPGLDDIIKFGQTPLADRLLSVQNPDEPEPTAELTFAVCRDCSLAQIRETVDPEVLFYEEYPYFSSVSPSLLAHFHKSADAIVAAAGLSQDDLVLEAASNDGYMLSRFAEQGVRVLGVDPAAAPARAALDAGIPTILDFFTADLAKEIRSTHGPASVFLANNVLAHVPDLNGFVQGIEHVLADDGMAVIEVPYVVDLVDNTEFDTIYHQHLCYFSVTALSSLFERNGLHLNDLERTSVHGGSLRLFVGRQPGRRPIVDAHLADEQVRGFDTGQAYRSFATHIDELKTNLRALLDEIRAQDLSIVGYGAAAKATTLLAYCGIDSDYLDYVCDLNERKHGRFMGGNRLPIVAPSRLQEDVPDRVLILAWNFAEEIVSQNQSYVAAGGRFIVPVPSPQVL